MPASPAKSTVRAKPPITFEQQLKVMPRSLDPISGLGQIGRFHASIEARAKVQYANGLAQKVGLENESINKDCPLDSFEPS